MAAVNVKLLNADTLGPGPDVGAGGANAQRPPAVGPDGEPYQFPAGGANDQGPRAVGVGVQNDQGPRAVGPDGVNDQDPAGGANAQRPPVVAAGDANAQRPPVVAAGEANDQRPPVVGVGVQNDQGPRAIGPDGVNDQDPAGGANAQRPPVVAAGDANDQRPPVVGVGVQNDQGPRAVGPDGVNDQDPAGGANAQRPPVVGAGGANPRALGAVGPGGQDNAIGEDAANVDIDQNLPPPVDAADEEQEPRNKKQRRDQNFTLKCVGEDISEDPSVPTTYRFTITMNKNPNKTYDVEVEEGDFHHAHLNWSKQIKAGFLYSPGPMSAFVELIKDAILDFEEQSNDEDEADEGGGGASKMKLKLKQESVVEIDGNVYFISGKNYVYMFTPDVAPYVKTLTAEEISELPVRIVYDGKEKAFNFDPKEVLKKFLKLIKDFNSVQRQQHQGSFVYACLQNMKSELYIVVEDHRIPIFYAKTTNAGKSMALLINDRIYNGKNSNILSGASEAGLKNSLKRGRVGRFDEIDKKDSGGMTKMMKVIWPSGGGKIEMGYGTIHCNTTVLISTNCYPEDLMRIWKMPHADLTKYDFNHFGETKMEHVCDHFQETLNDCLVQGGELNVGKPFLLALGYKIYKNRSTGSQIAKFDELVGTRNQRFAQGLVQKETFCDLLVSLADFFELPDEDIPTSVTHPSFNCILKSKDLVAYEAERKASDLISDVCRDAEEARKCLVIPTRGRQGVGICTSKLKDSSVWRPWMQRILNKLPVFDTHGSAHGGGRVRGRLVPLEELDDLFPIVKELLNVTAEKILSLMANERNKKKKQALKQLKDDVQKLSKVEIEDLWNDEEIDDDLNRIMPGNNDLNDQQLYDDIQMMEPDEGQEYDDYEEEEDEEGGDGYEGYEEEVMEESDEESVLKYEDGFYRCTLCSGKQWKTEFWAEAHVKKNH